MSMMRYTHMCQPPLPARHPYHDVTSRLPDGRQKEEISRRYCYVILLTDFDERNKVKKQKSSFVFLDIEGAFDHIAKGRLLQIMRSLALPQNLIGWTRTFLEERSIRLAFDSQIEDFSEVETGVPQGSPISPILFLIYIRDLFQNLKDVYPLSYIDDIALATSSISWNNNAKVLEREVKKITQTG
jgi:hypothetical protein